MSKEPEEIDEVVKGVMEEYNVDEVRAKDILENEWATTGFIKTHIQMIFITPRVSSTLRKLIEFAIMGGVCKATRGEIEELEAAIWHPKK